MIQSLKTLIDGAYVEGRFQYTVFRKAPTIAAVSGYWVDISMTPGHPQPNYYTGSELESTIPTDWYKKGIWHGGAVYPAKKYLHKLAIVGTGGAMAPAPFFLCDYLMYYPIIDMDNTDVQTLVNSVSLPRYTDGVGVRAFLVATNPFIGGAAFQINYTNSNGVANRVSQITITNTSTYIGTVVNSNQAGSRYGLFIELMQGDIGIRSVQSITFFGPNGGLAALVLVKPIVVIQTRETAICAEIDFIKDKMTLPRIYDGAYLNLLVCPTGTISGLPIPGEATFIWDN